MDCHSADFDEWLSGKCLYSNPPGWNWRQSCDGVTVAPRNWKVIAFLLTALVLFAGIGSATFISFVRNLGPLVLVIIAVPVGGLILVLVVFAVATVGTIKDQLAGPYLIYSVTTHEFRFSRDGLIPQRKARKWRVVTGNWVGPKGGQTFQRNAVSELHLIVEAAEGSIAYAVCGWSGVSMSETVKALAAATSLPCEFVDQQCVERHDDFSRLRDSFSSRS